MAEVTIYTDGSCSGNPGAGGYGIVLISGQYRKELSDAYALTTNQRMELLAVIVALESLKIKPTKATVYSDSLYVVNAINKKWLDKWVLTNFKNKKNPDLWKRFLEVYKQHDVEFIWVKGHATTEENNRCDQLALLAKVFKEKKIDVYYENIEKGRELGEEFFLF